MPDPEPPAGYIRIDNLGTPALVRVAFIVAVYDGNGADATRIVLGGSIGPEGGSLTINTHLSVDDVGAAIAAAAGG